MDQASQAARPPGGADASTDAGAETGAGTGAAGGSAMSRGAGTDGDGAGRAGSTVIVRPD
ncbi:hypothetical protein GCM10010519_75940 [Streptomyces lactacystinicus]